VNRLHPSPPARLAVYALFAFALGLQAFFVSTRGIAINVVALFCLAVSIILALVALYVSLSTPAPLTTSPPPSASSALVAFFVATWVAPFHYIVFYFALFALAALVVVPVHVFHFSDFWLALLVLLALGGSFLLEYFFLYLIRVTADSLPAPPGLPSDTSPP
jgi:hypothetical protein